MLANSLGRFSQTFTQTGSLIIWLAGGIFVLKGRLSIGSLVAFQAYLGQLYSPIQRFAEANETIQNSLSNIERIFEVFDMEPEIIVKEDAKRITHCEGLIEFSAVTFTYVMERPLLTNKDGTKSIPDIVELVKPDKRFYFFPPKTKQDHPPMTKESRLAFRNISFTGLPWEVIALVGQSGAGKTTLVNFISRFYDPDEGSVTLNASYSEVVEAAKAANAHAFIMDMEHNYQTIVGERGVRLSRGQKQRIAIARALLKKPQILVLDEATSALDAESEELVTEALQRIMKGRTTFIIAHRLATVVRADRILVMDQAGIVDQGTHSELLAAGGLYSELYYKQLKAMHPDSSMFIESL